MSDVSGNNLTDSEDLEDVSSSDVSSNDESSSSSSGDLGDSNAENESVTLVNSDSYDYTSNFENLQTIGILICSLLVAQALLLSFIIGFKK